MKVSVEQCFFGQKQLKHSSKYLWNDMSMKKLQKVDFGVNYPFKQLLTELPTQDAYKLFVYLNCVFLSNRMLGYPSFLFCSLHRFPVG